MRRHPFVPARDSVRGLLVMTMAACVNWGDPMVGGSEARAASTITRSVLGGGAGGADGAIHTIGSTLGQPVAGISEATIHTLRSGFWIPGADATDVPSASLPERFGFLPATPNPFRDETIIRYEVPASGGRVELRIHDVTGRVVRTLMAGEAVPGRQLLVWDGRDDRGRRLAHGLYLCTFEAPGVHRAQKLVRIR